jgi:hypothetical protein
MNREFLKMQKIAGLITENQYRQLTENTDEPTHMSRIDWYYVGPNSGYPGTQKDGRVVPKTRGYDDPSKYEDTNIYIKVGTEGWIDGEWFVDEEENRVPYTGYEEYFGSVSGEDEEEGVRLQPLFTPYHIEHNEEPPIIDNNEGLPLTDEVREYIDNFINMIIDEETEEDLEHLIRAEFFENEFEETLVTEFGEIEGEYDHVNSEVRRYIRQKVDQALHGN